MIVIYHVWLCLFVALGDIHSMYFVHVLCCIMRVKLNLGSILEPVLAPAHRWGASENRGGGGGEGGE